MISNNIVSLINFTSIQLHMDMCLHGHDSHIETVELKNVAAFKFYCLVIK